jgi:hypothetical protein
MTAGKKTRISIQFRNSSDFKRYEAISVNGFTQPPERLPSSGLFSSSLAQQILHIHYLLTRLQEVVILPSSRVINYFKSI